MTKVGSLYNWLIRNFIIKGAQNYKNPGFIILNFKSRGHEIYSREVLLPESLLIEIENKISEELGEKGIKLLYDIGVTLGYNFGSLFGVPNLDMNTKKEIETYSKFTMKFNFSTWCKDANILELDLDNKKIILEIDEHIVCRKNGKGYVLTEGAEAGFGKYLFSDKDIEVSQVKCQGRQDDKCETIWAKKDYLQNNNISYKSGEILYTITDFRLEKRYNLIQQARYANKATYDMLKSKILSIKANF